MLALHVSGRHAQVVLIAAGGLRQHLALVLGRRHAWRVLGGETGLVDGSLARRRADILLHRINGAWTDYDEASDPFDCTEAPPGVVRSLLGACLTG